MAALAFLSERLGVPVREFLGDETPAWTRLEGDLRLAAGDLSEALDIYQRLLDGATDKRVRAELLRGTGEALCRLNRGVQAIAPAAEAAELFDQLGRPTDAMMASYWLSFAQYQADNLAEARALLQDILSKVRGGVDVHPDFKLRVLIALANVELWDGEHQNSLAYLEEGRGLAEGLDDRRRAGFLFSLAINYRTTDDLEAALRTGNQALALYQAAECEQEIASLENNMALTWIRMGNTERAEESVTRARAVIQRLGDHRLLAHVAETEAQIALARQQPDAALERANQAIELASTSNNPQAAASAFVTRARAHLAKSNTDRATQSYQEAADVLRQHGPRARLREVLSEWAEVLSGSGRHTEANRLYREAVATGRSR